MCCKLRPFRSDNLAHAHASMLFCVCSYVYTLSILHIIRALFPLVKHYFHIFARKERVAFAPVLCAMLFLVAFACYGFLLCLVFPLQLIIYG